MFPRTRERWRVSNLNCTLRLVSIHHHGCVFRRFDVFDFAWMSLFGKESVLPLDNSIYNYTRRILHCFHCQ
jgi:hypothetical protein